MLRDASELKGFAIRATDGELGTAEQFYFDDDSWAVRYLTVETGSWLNDRQVLISPYSIVTDGLGQERGRCGAHEEAS